MAPWTQKMGLKLGRDWMFRDDGTRKEGSLVRRKVVEKNQMLEWGKGKHSKRCRREREANRRETERKKWVNDRGRGKREGGRSWTQPSVSSVERIALSHSYWFTWRNPKGTELKLPSFPCLRSRFLFLNVLSNFQTEISVLPRNFACLCKHLEAERIRGWKNQ